MKNYDSGTRPTSPILSFKEFVAERLQKADDSNAPGAGLSEQLAVPIARTNVASVDASKKLPALMTFQRKEVRMFSDGRVVGLYRETRTGVEILYPMHL